MPVTEGTSSYPTDNSGDKAAGLYADSNGFFYHPRVDNATAKNQRIALYAADGSVLIGQKAMAASIPIVIASDQSAIPVTLGADTDLIGRIGGQAAHDAAVADNPVRVAGRARTSDWTAVANDDQVDVLHDELGKQIVLPYAIPGRWLDGITAAITGTSDTAVIAAQGASTFINLTWALVINSHATVGTVVELKSNTTVRVRGYAAAAGGGFALRFSPPVKLAANVALNAANVTTGANTYVSAGGYVSTN